MKARFRPRFLLKAITEKYLNLMYQADLWEIPEYPFACRYSGNSENNYCKGCMMTISFHL
jgi:hypothetical protein